VRTLEDLRYSFRILLKNPGFAAIAIICLALGIGATSAIFSVVNAVMLRPLPYSRPEQLVRLYSEFPNFPGGGLRKFWLSAPEFLDLRREGKVWESLDGWLINGVNLAGEAEPIRVTACSLTGGMLPSLGVAPARGRVISPADDAPGAPLAAVISYGLWQRAFGAHESIVGRDTQLNGRRCTIVGVMPRGFQFPPGEADPPELWLPLQIDPAKPGSRGSHFLSVLGRMKPGVGRPQVRDDLGRLMTEWGSHDGPKNHVLSPTRHPVLAFPFHEEVVGGVRTAMLMLLGAVVFVLLISCVNVANLLLARAEGRQREIAIRSAIGAGVGRLVRQFITEGILLASAGAALGLLVAYAGLRLITRSTATGLPRLAEITIDGRILLFTLVISVLTGIFFGIAPIAHLVVRNLHESLKSASGRTVGSTGARSFRRVLVVSELSLALVLLIASGLMVRAFWKLQQVDIGMNPRGLVTLRVSLPRAVYKDNAAVDAFWTRLYSRLAALPGTQGAALMSGLPPARPLNANDTQIEGFVPAKDGPIQNVDYYQIVSKGYFETAGIRLIDGRFFNGGDGQGAPNVAIVNQTMARMFWPNQNPIGRRVRPSFTDPWCIIVGVVADVKNAGIDKPTGTEIYLPYSQPQGSGNRTSYVLLRGAGDGAGLAGAARREIQTLDAALPVAQMRSMEDVLSAAQSRPRFLTLLLTLFSTVALVLAAVGLYGVISYSVAQRTSEIGIRISMGAQSGDVLKLILGQGLRLGLFGVAVGAAGAVAFTRLIRGLLFGIDAFDPLTFAAMAAVLLGVVVMASYVPARRATKVDPMVALRYE
jgi:putative ABC transport system permease protein